MLVAGGMAVFLALVGMAVDMGMLVVTRTDLQKAADAAAFAAAQELPTAGSAVTMGESYVALNSRGNTTATVSVTSEDGSNDTVTVRAERPVSYMFLRFIGLEGADVSAEATTRVAAYAGGSGLLPFGFIASNDDNSTLLQNSCYTGQSGGVPTFRQNQDCVVKFGAGSNAGGDFGSLGLDGPGASTYRSSIINGSSSSFKVGDRVDPETGNMVGPTAQGIQQRFAKGTPAGCPGNSRSDVLSTNTDGTVSIRSGCEDSPRIGIIPVVDQIDNPQKSTILGFAFVFLKGYSAQGGGNGHADLTVEFVEFVTELPNSVYQGAPGAGDARTVKLVN